MSNTLRRKMFKLGGGVSKSHGVGLTSGLQYNQGGRVNMNMGGSLLDPAPNVNKPLMGPNTRPYNPPMSIGMDGTMIPKQSERPISQPSTGGMGLGTPPPAPTIPVEGAGAAGITLANNLMSNAYNTGNMGYNQNTGVFNFQQQNYNQGGRVEPQATFGVGNNANKMVGPDGKVREANVSFIPQGLAAIGSALARGYGARSIGATGNALKNFVQTGRTTGAAGAKLGEISQRLSPKVIANLKAIIAKGGPGAASAQRDLIKNMGKFGFGSAGRGSQILRGASLAAPFGLGTAGLGAVMAGADRAGLLIEGNDDRFIESMGRAIGKAGVDFTGAGAAYGLGQALFSSDKDKRNKSLYRALAGDKSEVAAIKKGPQDTIGNEEADAANKKSEAERRIAEYYKLLGGGQTNKMLEASKALLAATPLVAEGQYANAMAQAGSSLVQAQEQDQKIGQEAAITVMGEMKQEDAEKRKTINQIMLNTGLESAIEAERLYNAIEKTGSIEKVRQLPMKTDGKQDTELTETGVVYTDIANLSGNLFIVYSSDERALTTNDYTAALAHAAT